MSRARTPPKRSTRAQVAPAPALLRIWLSGARADAVFSADETEDESAAAAAAPSSETSETHEKVYSREASGAGKGQTNLLCRWVPRVEREPSKDWGN